MGIIDNIYLYNKEFNKWLEIKSVEYERQASNFKAAPLSFNQIWVLIKWALDYVAQMNSKKKMKECYETAMANFRDNKHFRT